MHFERALHPPFLLCSIPSRTKTTQEAAPATFPLQLSFHLLGNNIRQLGDHLNISKGRSHSLCPVQVLQHSSHLCSTGTDNIPVPSEDLVLLRLRKNQKRLFINRSVHAGACTKLPSWQKGKKKKKSRAVVERVGYKSFGSSVPSSQCGLVQLST